MMAPRSEALSRLCSRPNDLRALRHLAAHPTPPHIHSGAAWGGVIIISLVIIVKGIEYSSESGGVVAGITAPGMLTQHSLTTHCRKSWWIADSELDTSDCGIDFWVGMTPIIFHAALKSRILSLGRAIRRCVIPSGEN